jgi:hypothetical protein
VKGLMKKGDYWLKERKEQKELKMSDTSEEYIEQELPIKSIDASVAQEQTKIEEERQTEKEGTSKSKREEKGDTTYMAVEILLQRINSKLLKSI